MSDTANVARDTYQQHFARTPTTAGTRFSGTTSVRDRRGDPPRQFWIAGREAVHGREANVSPPDLLTQYDALMEDLRVHARRFDAASLLTAGWDHYTIVGSTTEADRVRPRRGSGSTSEWGQAADAGAFLSGSIAMNVRMHFDRAAEQPIPDFRNLEEALADLDGLTAEAREEDLPEPDPEAVENARVLLPRLFDIHPVRYQVSPTERRGVAIDAPMRRGGAVAVECAPDDTVYCFAAIDGNSRRAKFYQMDGLPDVFIAKALRDLSAG